MSPDASAAEGTVAPAGGEHLDDVHALGARALDEAAAAADLAALEEVRNRYLGRGDGLISARLRGIGQLPDPEQRRQVGQTLKALRDRVEEAIEERRGIPRATSRRPSGSTTHGCCAPTPRRCRSAAWWSSAHRCG